MKSNIHFVKVGNARVSEVHVCSVFFREDGAAIVHTIGNSTETSDPDEVLALRQFVGDAPESPEPEQHPEPTV